MNFSASSNPVLYVGLLLGCLLRGAGLLALAWRRPRRRQRGLRMLAGALAAASLWLSAAPPIRHLPASPSEAIVLTPGYSPDSLRRLLSALGPGTAVWAYDSAAAPAFAKPLPSLLTLAEHRPALHRVHVLGRGLTAADLPQLGLISILPHEDAGFSGFETAYWPGRLALGEVLTIEGTISSGAAPGPGGGTGVTASAGKPAFPSGPESSAASWVVLRAAGMGRDSVRLPLSTGPFHLHYQPKTAGLACYELLLKHQGQPTQREPVPVEVTVQIGRAHV